MSDRVVYRFTFAGGGPFGLDVDGIPCHHDGSVTVHDVYTDETVALETVEMAQSLGVRVTVDRIVPDAPYRKNNPTERADFEAKLRARGRAGFRIRRVFDEELDVREDEEAEKKEV